MRAPELAALAGQTGVLAVALVDYAGSNLFNASSQPPSSAETARRSVIGRSARKVAGDGWSGRRRHSGRSLSWMMRSTKPCSSISVRSKEREQKHFEQAIGQLERFVDDKVLVCRRERASISEKLRSARDRRDEVVGSSARDRVEAEILRLAEKDEALERRINALDSREDEVYRKWRNEYHDLRYRAPKVTRLFQVRVSTPRSVERGRPSLPLKHSLNWPKQPELRC